MFSDKVHLLIKSLDAYHVSLCIICQFDLVTSADAFGPPVEISHVYRTSHLACDSVETCLPSFYRFACTLRSKSEMYDIFALHLLDYAESHIAASFSVHRYTSHLSQKPSKRPYKEFSLHHAVRLTAY